MGRKKTLASKSQAYTRWSLTPLHTEVAELAASHIEKAEIQIDKFASEPDIKGQEGRGSTCSSYNGTLKATN